MRRGRPSLDGPGGRTRGVRPTTPPHLPLMKYRFKTKPYPHQVRALRRAMGQHHIGLLWEPGTGKSKFIVDWSCALFQQGKIERVLIVCPLSVVGVWEDEYEIHATCRYEFHAMDKNDRVLPRKAGRLTVVVVNYDLVWRRDPAVHRYNPSLVVADESHRIKKPSARRSRYLRRYNTVPYRAILTGTPTPKSYVDIYGQWAFLNPKRFGTNFADFKADYIRYGGYMGKVIRGYRNVHILTEKIDRDAEIIRKQDVLDLPPQYFQRVPVLLETRAWQAYHRMAYELFLELKNGDVSDAKNVAVKILRLQQITGGWIRSDEGNIHQISRAKIDACEERMEDLWNDDQRVVVFARFKPELDAITALGTRHKIPTYVVRGGVGRQERDEARRQFQAKGGPSLFIAQIQAGGLGITLHSSHEVIFYSVTQAYDDYKQATDRVHRSGQRNPVRYQHLVATSTVDIDIYANLRAKKNMMDVIMSPRGRRELVSSLAKNLGL